MDRKRYINLALAGLLFFLNGCQAVTGNSSLQNIGLATSTATLEPEFTPLPTRLPYEPGDLVDYIAQPGDNLPALASHFNTTVDGIRKANPVIPQDATTMPPGFPMKIPIYYKAFWGSPYKILPDSLFVNGPAQVGFNTDEFIRQHPGWLKDYRQAQLDGMKSAGEVIDIVARNFSISPRLLLTLLEYQSSALSSPEMPRTEYFLNYRNAGYSGLYLQMVWAANSLNNSYYSWRRGDLTEWMLLDGRMNVPDPWQNAATVALQHYFSRMASGKNYEIVIGPRGVAAVYADLFGDPWLSEQPHIPGSLEQPEFLLPFGPGQDWNYTGGPHTGWGKGEPFAAIDFAPTGVSDCNASDSWVLAMADGVVVRSDVDGLTLDLDGDGHDQTGWAIFYLHLDIAYRPALGEKVSAGQRLGHPSCEGGESTGTHVHIARKYNGEWMLADGPVPFTMAGWVVQRGNSVYEGFMTRYSKTVIASTQSEATSLIRADDP